MKVLFYFLWGVCTISVLLAILFNHYAEFYLNDSYVDALFNEYTKQWAYTNVGITFIWITLTWIGLHLIYKKDGPSIL